MTDTKRFAVKLRSPDGEQWREFFCEAADVEDARELAEEKEREFIRKQAEAIVAAGAAPNDGERLAILNAAGLPSDPGAAFEDEVGVRKYLRDNTYQVESITAED